MSDDLLTACALWLIPPGGAQLRSEVLRAPRPSDLLVRTRYSAVSRGTESLVYRGEVPASEYQRMRAPFQEGSLPGPVKHGYANVGVVEAGPSQWRGRTVFCLYPHQTRYVVPAESVVALPRELPPMRAVLAANMETAVNALWDAGVQIGDRVAIVGAGVIGSLVASLCTRLPAVQVQLVDVDPGRALVAEALGAQFALPDAAATGCDVVFHASASAGGLNTALRLAGLEARVIELSWYGTRSVQLALGGGFHSQRLTLQASQVGRVAPGHAARWNRHDRLALAVGLCCDPRLDVLFAPDVSFADLPATMARLATSHDRTLCQRVVYDDAEMAVAVSPS